MGTHAILQHQIILINREIRSCAAMNGAWTAQLCAGGIPAPSGIATAPLSRVQAKKLLQTLLQPERKTTR
jgi:hypothetical protein